MISVNYSMTVLELFSFSVGNLNRLLGSTIIMCQFLDRKVYNQSVSHIYLSNIGTHKLINTEHPF